MLFNTIRSQIALYLSLLLFSGMLLIAMTALLSFENIAVVYAVKNNAIIFENLIAHFRDEIRLERTLSDSYRLGFGMELENSGVCRIYYIDQNKKPMDFGSCGQEPQGISEIAKAALGANGIDSRLITSGLNIPFLSNARKFIVISGPIKSDTGQNIGALAAAWDYDVVFSGVARLEKLLFIYIFINTFVLVAVGVYQIGNITAKPMKKILKRTESVFHADFPLAKNSGSDFDQLSSSIGFLVDDLSLNKKNLQATVSELESANRNMEEMQKEIVRAEKMASIGRLSAGLAHEIGNPVGIISGYLEMLKQNEIDDNERIEYASRADYELKRIDFIIRELLDYARPSDHGKVQLSVHQLINDIVRAYAGSRAIGSITLITGLHAEFDSVIANFDQLRQVFMNLIINAADAIFDSENRNNGQLTISTVNIPDDEFDRSHLMISFIDNGCGLPEKDLENVFDPFFTTKPQGKGTGLGLSVSLMIIEDIGGSIKAYPCDKCGTEFRIILPVTKEIMNI